MTYVPRTRTGGLALMGAGGRTMHPSIANLATEVAARTIQGFMQKTTSRTKTKRLTDTKDVTRKTYNKHHKLKSGQKAGPVNKGKGAKRNTAGRVLYTHPRGSIPKWKHDRLKTYDKGNVWQTVLLSKSARVANSNNVLASFRYPIKAPECLDANRVQAMVFSPFCSHYSGNHTTYFRKIRADGTDLDHDTATPLDVIQNKADVQRHSLPGSVEGTGGTAIKYETDTISAAVTQQAAELNNVHCYYDQCLKEVNLDLIFLASRIFDTRISVTLVRHLQPTAPFTWTTEDKQQLFNNLDNRGCQWESYKFEYHHEFTLKGLTKDKDPPMVHLKKVIKTNLLETAAFNEDTVDETMAQSSLNQLGLGIHRQSTEVADGNKSNNVYLLIKYKKVNKPQQFTYIQAIQNSYDNVVSSIEMPALSEDTFNVGQSNGANVGGQDGTPFKNDYGDESKASFYLQGTIKYNWGFREDTEAIPSLMSANVSSANYKKSQALNIDPTITGGTVNSIYTQSPVHQTLATNTANSGP